jgi:hypothetical protein
MLDRTPRWDLGTSLAYIFLALAICFIFIFIVPYKSFLVAMLRTNSWWLREARTYLLPPTSYPTIFFKQIHQGFFYI